MTHNKNLHKTAIIRGNKNNNSRRGISKLTPLSTKTTRPYHKHSTSVLIRKHKKTTQCYLDEEASVQEDLYWDKVDEEHTNHIDYYYLMGDFILYDICDDLYSPISDRMFVELEEKRREEEEKRREEEFRQELFELNRLGEMEMYNDYPEYDGNLFGLIDRLDEELMRLLRCEGDL